MLIAGIAGRADHDPESLDLAPAGELAPPDPGAPVGADDSDGGARPGRGWMPSPRVAALAVMGMLAFGAEIGAAVGASGVVTLSSAPLIVVRQAIAPPPTATPTPAADAGSAPAPASTPAPTSSAPATPAAPASSAGAPAATPTTTTTSTTTPTNSNPYGLPPIQHVFVIMMANQGYSHTFGSTDTYLAKTLPKRGKLIEWYYAVAGSELANEIGLISGQGPTEATESGCSTFANVAATGAARYGEVLGNGCVYPKKTATLAEQLTAAHLTWKAYVQGMALGQPQACRHPAIGTADQDQTPRPGDPYVTLRNPFVYFHSVIDVKTCRTKDVDLSQLSIDLQHASSTPSLSYIVPGRCDDGSDEPCTPGASSGVAGADSFLRTVVPQIQHSPAYQAGGLIAITFDQAPQTGPDADPSACCATPPYPNLPAGASPPTSAPTTTGTTTTAPGSTTGAPPTDPDDHVAVHHLDIVINDHCIDHPHGPRHRHDHHDDDHHHHDHHGPRHRHDDDDHHGAAQPGRGAGTDQRHRRRGSGRSAAAVALGQGGHGGPRRLLQPLLAAGQHRGHLRSGPPRVRQAVRARATGRRYV